ncbi:hypothetical protein [Rhodococcus sp. NPDC058521]|uniref:hypothetical protein n=1 Tax=Rhodococcus sp. NPDC058521 TaxID=3346536 RepID=UPI00364E0A53
MPAISRETLRWILRDGRITWQSTTKFSPHRHPTFREWGAAHDVEFVFLPTYGSWLTGSSPSSPRCGTSGTDRRSHAEQNAANAAYMRWHNAHAEPKTNFAPDSHIRSWAEHPHYPPRLPDEARDTSTRCERGPLPGRSFPAGATPAGA